MYIIHVFKKHLVYPWALENRKHYLINNLGALSIFEKCKCFQNFFLTIIWEFTISITNAYFHFNTHIYKTQPIISIL